MELIADCGVDLKVRITPQAAQALELAPGVGVYLLIKASSCRICSEPALSHSEAVRPMCHSEEPVRPSPCERP